jgi:hypothetical protein
MSETPPTNQPERNLDTYAVHKQETFRQVILPTVIGLIVIIAMTVAVIYAGFSGNAQLSRWADISLVWVLLPAMMFSLLFLVLLVGLTIGVTKLLYVIPIYTYRLQLLIRNAQTRINKATDLAVEPVLRVNSFLARARTLLRR